MAEGFLKSFDNVLEVHSAGTTPSVEVHPKAIRVMKEIHIDISRGHPHHVNEYVEKDFDYVITVCGGAKESCPIFTGSVKEQLHIGFDDPADATGTEDEVLDEFRKVRDEIKRGFNKFYKDNIKR